MVPDFSSRLWVQPESRFVQEQYSWAMHETSRHFQTPSHAPRVGLNKVVTSVIKVHKGEDLVHARSAGRSIQAVEPTVKIEILRSSQFIVKTGILENHTYDLPDRMLFKPDIVSANGGGTA